MKCANCKRDVNRGTELNKAIAEYQQADKTMKYYGWDRPDGKLFLADPSVPKPTGRLTRIFHYKCFRLAEKREARGGDSVTGRGMGAIPTAYEIGKLTANQDELKLMGVSEEEARTTNTAALTERVRAARKAATAAGTGAEDQAYKEKMRAEAQGGPYTHRHATGVVERHRIKAHLQYAHGVAPEDIVEHYEDQLRQHNEEHAKSAAAAKRIERENDPGYKDPGLSMSDWRHQEVREASELPVPEEPIEERTEETVSFDDLT